MPDPTRPDSAGDYVAFFLYRLFSFFIAALPRPAVLAAGGAAGRLAFRLDGRHRGIALRNLALAFGPEKSPGERRAIAVRSFRNAGRVIFETVKMASLSRARVLALVEVEGRRHLDQALARGRGALIFTAHYGNWEVGCGPISESAPFGVVARTLDNRLIDRDLVRMRERLGAAVINKVGASRRILQALHRNEVVGILIDQNVLRREAVFVDFFGKPAGTTPGLAAFHLKTGAPLLPLFIDPLPRGRHRLRILEPLVIPPSGFPSEDVLKITQICTKMIEREIRRNPEAWLWVHKRWQSRPADERQKSTPGALP
jgi:KDO2-lipid IV(A) lauroyltransferase